VITVYFSVSALGLPIDGDVWGDEPLQAHVERRLLQWLQTHGPDVASWLSKRRVRFVFDYLDSAEHTQRGTEADIELRRSEIVITLARDASAISGGPMQEQLLESEYRELTQLAISILSSLVDRT
jgi:hypothetical protein